MATSIFRKQIFLTSILMHILKDAHYEIVLQYPVFEVWAISIKKK